MSYQPRFPNHKLTRAHGQHYLWHALAYLQRSDMYWHNEDYLACERAMTTIRALLDSLLAEEAA